ncbi:MAG: hypothetical protein R3F33_10335 [Planctomycetota bacterium]
MFLPFAAACLAQSVLTASPAPPSPFPGLDTFATGAWWQQDSSGLHELKVARDQVLAFGLYTQSEGVLKISAQLYPLYPTESREVRLSFFRGGAWQPAAASDVDPIGWSTCFRVEGWHESQPVRYRLEHGEHASFEGSIRPLPTGDEIVIAALSCNSNQDRGPRADVVRNVQAIDPDLIAFLGDQSYDHKQHTAAWLLFGSQFKETFRTRPCVTIPDDHDIGQGNLWGESGKVAKLAGGADGGYFHHPDYVRMVERCQTAHLPDPVDPAPVERGIGVYFTHLELGWLSLAILEDRKFKSGPAGKIPKMGPRPDHINDPAYDPAAIDLPGLVLLGERQLTFLDRWGKREGPAMRAVLSQTGFAGAAHLHGSKDGRLHADLDSNGWPQTGRLRALTRIQAAGAVHIGGDQHIATLVQHGLEAFRDGPWSFVVPAVQNDYYGRWWWPLDELPGANRDAQSPLLWTGDYRDGFGNRITMHAYANPESAGNGAGFGVVRFRKSARSVTFECWPRGADVTQGESQQFPGWPRTVFPGRSR